MEPLLEKLDALKSKALDSFLKEQSPDALYNVKVHYLGKKGLLTDILKEIGSLPQTDRPLVGQKANQVKVELEEVYARCLGEIKDRELLENLKKESLDVTLPGIGTTLGSLHPVSLVMEELKSFFRRFGFDIHEGPEIENDYYNFEALNIPKDHPARDMQDTFYLAGGQWLLRTHTSPVQIHVMEKTPPPIQMIAPGTVYRRDSDVSHTPMFHQIEGLMVGEGIHMGHLKGVIEAFLQAMFGDDRLIRFRPSFFPFTEPSAEVDMDCVMCAGTGCRVCKETGWLEIMGCGMVDPAVFEHVGIDPKKYSGFAFGVGVERMAMLKYGIDDIRLFFENDLRFLEQF